MKEGLAMFGIVFLTLVLLILIYINTKGKQDNYKAQAYMGKVTYKDRLDSLIEKWIVILIIVLFISLYAYHYWI